MTHLNRPRVIGAVLISKNFVEFKMKEVKGTSILRDTVSPVCSLGFFVLFDVIVDVIVLIVLEKDSISVVLPRENRYVFSQYLTKKQDPISACYMYIFIESIVKVFQWIAILTHYGLLITMYYTSKIVCC